jgi:hypothetical protein
MSSSIRQQQIIQKDRFCPENSSDLEIYREVDVLTTRRHTERIYKICRIFHSIKLNKSEAFAFPCILFIYLFIYLVIYFDRLRVFLADSR